MTGGAARDAVLEAVPDAPRWIELRAALLDPECRVLGDASRYVVVSKRLEVGGIGGDAPEDLIREAVADIVTGPGAGEFALIVPEGSTPSARAALSQWSATSADIFLEPEGGLGPILESGSGTGVELGLLRPDELPTLDRLPRELAAELRGAAARTDLAVARVDGRPVSFCYAACETETLWDVSINTLEGYRRRGLAAAVVMMLADRMRPRGKRAVWGAHTWNRPSRRLAEKLGFEPRGRLELFEARPSG